MRTIIVGIVALAVLAGFGLNTVPARAQEPSSAPAALSQEEASILKQALDVLGTLIAQAGPRLTDPENAEVRAGVAATLGEIGKSLASINSAIVSSAPIVKREPPVPEKPLAAAPAEPENTGPAELYPSPVAASDKTADEVYATAQTASSFGKNARIGIVIAILVGLGVLLFARTRGKEELAAAPAKGKASNAVMISEKTGPSAQNFKSDLPDSAIDMM